MNSWLNSDTFRPPLLICMSKIAIFKLAKKGKWQMWQCTIWAIFDVQISYGGLKVSEFNQESISEV